MKIIKKFLFILTPQKIRKVSSLLMILGIVSCGFFFTPISQVSANHGFFDDSITETSNNTESAGTDLPTKVTESTETVIPPTEIFETPEPSELPIVATDTLSPTTTLDFLPTESIETNSLITTEQNLPAELIESTIDPFIIENGMAISLSKNQICSYRISDQAEQWCFNGLDGIGLSGVYSNTVIIYGHEENNISVVGLDLGSGTTRWHKELAHESGATYTCSSENSGMIACSVGSTITVFDLSDQNFIWSTVIDGKAQQPIIYANRVFCGTDKGYVVSLNLQNGELIWQNRKNVKNLIGVENEVISSGSDNLLSSLDISNGDLLWSQKLEGSSGCPMIYQNNILIISAKNGTVNRIDPADGSAVWSFNPLYAKNQCPNIGMEDNLVYASFNDGSIKAIDLSNGALSWEESFINGISVDQLGNDPFIVNNGSIIFELTGEGILVANVRDVTAVETDEVELTSTTTPSETIIPENKTMPSPEPEIFSGSSTDLNLQETGDLVLSSLDRNYIFSGSTGFELTVNGEGYLESSVINWNNTPLATTFINENQLIAEVPSSLLLNSGTAELIVKNSLPESESSNALIFTIIGYSPAIGQKLSTPTVTFDWDDIPDANAYTIQFSSYSNFSTLKVNTITNSSSFSYTTKLTDRQTYYWRIKVKIGDPWSDWSEVWYFYSMNPLSSPIINAPANAQIINNNAPELNWSAVTGAAKYEVQISQTTSFSALTNDSFVEGAYSFKSDVLADGQYYWRVRAIDDVGVNGAWSNYRTFLVDTVPPISPAIKSPVNDATILTNTPTLTVTSVSGAKYYQFQVARDEIFTTILADVTKTTAYCIFSKTNPLPFGKLYWHSRSIDAAGNTSAWSDISTFTINIIKTPKDLSYTTDQTPTFTWASATGALQYQLQVSSEKEFGSIIIDTVRSPSNSYTPVEKIDIGNYFWRMRIQTTSGTWEEWTPVVSFKITPAPLVAPILTSPLNAAIINNASPSLGWNTVAGASSYQVQISKSSSFSTLQEFGNAAINSYSAITVLPDGTYYWRVRSVNNLDVPGKWSSYRSMILDTIAPKEPTLSSPITSASIRGTTKYIWLASTGAKYYQFQYCSDVNCNLPVFTSGEITSLYITPDIQDPGSYFWRVRARDLAGNWGNWSPTRSISILPIIPAAPALDSPITGTTITSYSIPLSWKETDNAETYQISVDNDSNFSNPEITLITGSNHTTLDYLPNGIYYWHVRAMNISNEAGIWSSSRKFILNAPIDNSAPNNPSGLLSTSHSLQVFSSNPIVVMTWNNDSSDGDGIGLAGYSYIWDQSVNTVADSRVDLSGDQITTFSQSLTNGIWYFHLRACDYAGNCSTGLTVGPYKIDNIAPNNPSEILSSSHSIITPSNQANITIQWSSDANDANESGIKGYSILWNQTSDSIPDTTVDYLPAVTSITSNTLEDGTWYFHFRTCDLMRQCADPIHLGPFVIDTKVPTNPSELSCTSHVLNDVNVSDNTIDINWSNDTSDSNGVGLAGYSLLWDHQTTNQPDNIIEISRDINSTTSQELENGSWYLHFAACDRAGNCASAMTIGPYLIDLPDSTPPVNPSTISSPGHPVNGYANDPQVNIIWSTDSHDIGGAGINGYSTEWDQNPSTEPDSTVDVFAPSVSATYQATVDGPWYFHLRTCDKNGNCSQTIHAGPFMIDTVAPSNVSTVYSVSHVAGGAPLTDTTIDMVWINDADEGTGSPIAGVSAFWDTDPDSTPDNTIDYPLPTHYATSPKYKSGAWYFHLRTCDTAGNCSTTITTGPYYISLPIGNLCGKITSDTTWDSVGGFFQITCPVEISKGVTVTVAPGSIFKATTNTAQITVYGNLIGQGTEDKNIVFTSIRDDSSGGDSNIDGSRTSPQPGDWVGIYVDYGKIDLNFSAIKYGGYYSQVSCHADICSGSHSPEIKIQNSIIAYSNENGVSLNEPDASQTTILTIDNSQIVHNNRSGIFQNYYKRNSTIPYKTSITNSTISENGTYLSDCGFTSSYIGNLVFTGNTISNNFGSAAVMEISNSAAFSDLSSNSGSGNTYNSFQIYGSISSSVSLPEIKNMVYEFYGITINSGTTLTIEPGAILKFGSYGITVNGSLIANGTEEKPIVFTSIKDDSFGGDSNADGSRTLPAKSDWYGISASSGSSITLDHVVVAYAGETPGNYRSLVYIKGNVNYSVTNSLLEHSKNYGLVIDTSTVGTIAGNTIKDCLSSGIYIYNSIIDKSLYYSNISNNTINNTSIPIRINNSSLNGDHVIYGNGGTGNTNQYISFYNSIINSGSLGADNSIDWGFEKNITINGTASIDPGTVIKFGEDASLTISGQLNAVATSGNEIVFTSIDDQEYGYTSGDGIPNTGDWNSLIVNGSIDFEHVLIRYGGATAYNDKSAMVYVNTTQTYVLTDSTFQYSKSSGLIVYGNNNPSVIGNTFEFCATGIRIRGSSSSSTPITPIIRNNVINHSGIPIVIEQNSKYGFSGNYTITGNTGSENSNPSIFLPGYVNGETALSSDNDFDWQFSSLTIYAGASLTLSPGTIIKITSNSFPVNLNIDVYGSLNAIGSSGNEIIFTSGDDREYGQATGDGLPKKGDWYGISAENNGTVNLDHVKIRYAVISILIKDGSNSVLTNSLIEHSSLYGVEVNGIEEQSLQNNTIDDCGSYGIYITDTDTDTLPVNPLIQDNVINNSKYPIYFSATDGYTGDHRITGNTGIGNNNNYIYMPSTMVGNVAFGQDNGFDWAFDGISIPSSASLTLDPNTVIKMDTGGIFVTGTLTANASTGNEIIFTSLDDQEYGEITGDGIPEKGDWTGIVILDSGSSFLNHAIVRYAGAQNTSYAPPVNALVTAMSNGSLTLNNSTLEHSSGYGVDLRSSSYSISGNSFTDIDYDPIFTGN